MFQPPKCDQVGNNIISSRSEDTRTNILSYLYRRRRRRRLHRRPVSKRPWCVQRPLNEKKKSLRKKMFSTHVVSPPHGTGSRWCGEAAAAAATVTTTHFYWLYVRVFYTYMVFFSSHSLLAYRILCFRPTSIFYRVHVCECFFRAYALVGTQRIPRRGKMK